MKKIGLISLTASLFAFGMRSIAAYLKSLEYHVFTVNCCTSKNNAYNILNEYQLKILAEKCRDCVVIGISVVSTHNLKRVEQIAKYLIKNTDAHVILGGVPVIADPYTYLKFADFVCLGEGELFLDNFIKAGDKSTVPGLGYKSKNGKIIKNPLPPLIDINKLPIPFLDFKNTYQLDDDRITSLAESQRWLYSSCFRGYRIYSIRGCPFSCTYCVNSKLNALFKDKGKTVRVFNVGHIIEELEYAKRIVPELNMIAFLDDDFTARPSGNFSSLVKEYGEKIGLPITFVCTTYTLTKEKLDLLKKHGVQVKSIEIGLQTASERMQKDIYNRNFNKNKFLEKVELILSYNIDVKIYIILQNPYENVNDYIENLDFYQELGQRLNKKNLPGNLIELYKPSLRFYPGTELYDKALKDGIIDKNYVEENLLSRGKIHIDSDSPLAPDYLSIDIILAKLYYLLILNKGNVIYHCIKKPIVLSFLKKLCSTKLATIIYKYYKHFNRVYQR